MNTKRKLNTLTLADKIKVIEAVKTKSKKKKDIAEEFKIPVSTLSTNFKKRERNYAEDDNRCKFRLKTKKMWRIPRR